MAFDFMTKVDGVPGRREVKSGMAHFAGGGPAGATCGKCLFWGYTANSEKKCFKFRQMVGDWGANLRKTQSACKYFEPKPPQT